MLRPAHGGIFFFGKRRQRPRQRKPRGGMTGLAPVARLWAF